MALALAFPPIGSARADCSAAPLQTATDMVVSFLTAGTTQAGPATLFASTVEKGMLVYDGTANALKYCDGVNWLTLADSGGLGANAAGAAGYVQLSDGSGGLTYSGVTAGQQFFWDNTNKRLGIGTASPAANLEIQDTGYAPTRGLLLSQHNSGAQAAVFNFRKSRNTGISPQAVANGDYIGVFFAQPYDGSAYIQPAGFGFVVNGAVSAGSVPVDLIISAGSTNASSLQNERLRVAASGNVGIGTSAPNGRLHLRQAADTATGGLVVTNTGGSASASFYVDSSYRTHIGGTTASPDAIVIQNTTGNVGIGTTSPASRLQVAGGIQLGNDAATCPGDADIKVGTLRFNTGNLELCTTGGWGAISGGLAEAAGAEGQIQFNDGADELAADAALHWDNTNKMLGIGTSAPNSTLDVAGRIFAGTDGSSVGRMTFATSPSAPATTPVWNIDGSGGTMRFFREPDLNTAGTVHMVIDDTGNVGIGTASPAGRLHINAGTNADSIITGWNNSNTDIDGLLPGTAAGSLILGGNLGHMVLGLRDNDANDGVYVLSGGGNYNTDSTYDTVVLAAKADGKVGIGTSAPTSRLHVVGGALFDEQAGDGAAIKITERSTLYGGKLAWLDDTQAFSAVIGKTPGDSLAFYTGGLHGSGQEKMVLTSTGNLGIGTAAPTVKLQIDASGTNNHIILKNTAGAQRWGISNDSSSLVITNGAPGVNGTGVWLANGAQSWSAISDRALKTDVTTLSVLERLKDYRAVSYVFKPSGKREIGVIAQELQPLFPELVAKSPDGLLGVSYDRLGAIALEGVKELKAENDALKANNKNLQELNASVMQRLDALEAHVMH